MAFAWIHSRVTFVDHVLDSHDTPGPDIYLVELANGFATFVSGTSLGCLVPVIGMGASLYGRPDTEDGGFDEYAFVLGERMIYDYRAKYLPDANKG